MPAKYLLVNKNPGKQIAKLPQKIKTRVAIALFEIKGNPLSGSKLHGELSDFYKFRIGDYRIIYEFDKKNSIVAILKIEHRKGVYR